MWFNLWTWVFLQYSSVFQTVYSVPHPVFLLEGPPPGKKTPLETLDNPEFEKRMRAHNGDMLRASIEDPYETEIRVGRAPYMRAKIIEALIDAVSTLKPSAIRHAWNCCHLYPFYGSPNYSKEEKRIFIKPPEVAQG